MNRRKALKTILCGSAYFSTSALCFGGQYEFHQRIQGLSRRSDRQSSAFSPSLEDAEILLDWDLGGKLIYPFSFDGRLFYVWSEYINSSKHIGSNRTMDELRGAGVVTQRDQEAESERIFTLNTAYGAMRARLPSSQDYLDLRQAGIPAGWNFSGVYRTSNIDGTGHTVFEMASLKTYRSFDQNGLSFALEVF